MKKFLAIFSTESEITLETHPRFFSFLLSTPQSARLSNDVFLFLSDGDASSAYNSIRKLLTDDDDLIVFSVSGSKWGVFQPELDSRLKQCLQGSFSSENSN